MAKFSLQTLVLCIVYAHLEMGQVLFSAFMESYLIDYFEIIVYDQTCVLCICILK